MFKRITIYSICLLYASIIGVRSFQLQPRIYGGNAVEAGRYPYQASVRKLHRLGDGNVQSQHFCGGAVIGARWILTAAHCLGNITLESDESQSILADVIVLGAFHLFNDGIWYDIEQAIVYPEGSTAANDIGLLQTKQNIEFGRFVQPIALNSQAIAENSLAVVSGWGNDRSGIYTLYLNHLAVRVINNAECVKSHNSSYSPFINKKMICTLSLKDYGVCFGDSGGPLAYKNRLIGVISWGVPCGLGFPDQYTKVDSFLGWIQRSTGINAT